MIMGEYLPDDVLFNILIITANPGHTSSPCSIGDLQTFFRKLFGLLVLTWELGANL